MTAHCPNCDSTNVWRDAYVNVNDKADIREYDDMWCDDCESHPTHLNYKED